MVNNAKEKKKLSERLWFKLVLSAVMIALAVVLSQIKLIRIPGGGSITPLSMLPIIFVAYLYGIKWGLLTGSVCGIIQLLIGWNSLNDLSLPILIGTIALDFILAYAMLGFGAAFKKKIKNHAAAFACGAALCCILKFLCHFISGVVFCENFAGDLLGAVNSSLFHNLSYMGPETIVTIIVAALFAGAYGLMDPAKDSSFVIGNHMNYRH